MTALPPCGRLTDCGLRLVSTFWLFCQGLLTTLQVALPSSRTSSLLPKLTCLSGLPESRLVSPHPSPQWLPNTSPLTIPHVPHVPNSSLCLHWPKPFTPTERSVPHLSISTKYLRLSTTNLGTSVSYLTVSPHTCTLPEYQHLSTSVPCLSIGITNLSTSVAYLLVSSPHICTSPEYLHHTPEHICILHESAPYTCELRRSPHYFHTGTALSACEGRRP